MTKDQFLNKLDVSLKGLVFNERKDILQDYKEHFEIGLEEGKTEEEIAARLGSPSAIGKELLASYHIEKVRKDMTAGNILRAVWAVIGLGFFNLVIVLGPFFALVVIIFSLWSVALSFAVAPVMVLLKLLFHPSSFILFDLFLKSICKVINQVR